MTRRYALNDRTRTRLQTKSSSTSGVKRTTRIGYHVEGTSGVSLRAMSGDPDDGLHQVYKDYQWHSGWKY